MVRAILILLLVLSGSAANAGECVILLHGLLRSATAMEPMEESLREAGFTAVNVDYPSRDHKIEELAPIAIEEGLARCKTLRSDSRVHFVTHSLGGILVRQYLSTKDIPALGRVVMLGPPNQGSAAVDNFKELPGFEWLNGPAGYQLGKGEESVPLRLGPADFELGVIAGNRSIDPVTSAVLDDPDDGRVSVDDTKLEGMTDFTVVDHSHAYMMRMAGPIELTIRFLETGSFDEG